MALGTQNVKTADLFLQIQTVQHLKALFIDQLTLLIHYVIVKENVLTSAEVFAFQTLLRIFNGFRKKLNLKGLIFIHTKTVCKAKHPIGAEKTEQIVFQRKVEGRITGVALTAASAAELVIDTAGFVALGTQNVKTARFSCLFRFGRKLFGKLSKQFLITAAHSEDLFLLRIKEGIGYCNECVFKAFFFKLLLCHKLRVTAKLDIGTSSRHIGGNGYRTGGSCLRNDLGFQHMLLCVENVVGDLCLFQKAGKVFRTVNGNGTHKYRLPLLVALADLFHDGAILSGGGLIHNVGMIHSRQGTVGGDLHYVKIIDLAKLRLFGQGGTGHTGKLAVQTEIILEGNGCQCFGFLLNIHPFFGFDGLMETLGIASTGHHTTRKGIHDDNLTVLDHVVLVAVHRTTGSDGLIDMVIQNGIFGIGKVFHGKEAFSLGNTVFGKGSTFGFFIHDVIRIQILIENLVIGFLDLMKLHGADQIIGTGIKLGGGLPFTGNDQRGTCFINQDTIHLVHDGKGLAALHHIFLIKDHIVAQVVKAQLVIGGIGNIGKIGAGLFFFRHIPQNQPNGKTKEIVDLSHPFRISLGKILVYRNDMNAFARQCVKVGRQGRHQGFTLTGLHFRNAALMKDYTADQLNAVMTGTQHTIARFSDNGKGFGQNIIQRLAVCQTFLKGICHSAKLCGRHCAEARGKGLYFIHNTGDLFYGTFGISTEHFFNQTHRFSFSGTSFPILENILY